MTRRVMLAFGAMAVIAAIVILYIAITTDDSGASTSPAADPQASPEEARGSTTRTRPDRANAGDSAGGTTDTAGPPPVREFVTADGRRVRDHRRNPPRDGGAETERVKPPPVPTELTQKVATDLKAVMAQCLVDLPRRKPGEKRRLEGELIVSIKDHQLKVDEARLGIPQLDGEAVTAAVQCVQQKSVGIATTAPDATDLERSSIRVSLALP